MSRKAHQKTLYNFNDLELTKSLYGRDFDNFLSNVFSKTRDINQKVQIYNMCKCQKGLVPLNNNSKVVHLQETCDNRFCPHCSELRSIRQNSNLKKFFKSVSKKVSADNMRFVTLTYKSCKTKKDLEFCLSNISKDMLKFKRNLAKFGYNKIGGYRVLEITYSEEFGYHPHIHELYFCKLDDNQKFRDNYSKFRLMIKNKYSENISETYQSAFMLGGSHDGFIDYKVLNYIWLISNHSESFVTKPIRFNVHKINSGVNYICKYLTKGFYDESYSVDVLSDLYLATNNFRFIQKFGEVFKGFKQSLFKSHIYYKDDVDEFFSGQNKIIIPKENAKKFVYGLNLNCDFIDKTELRFVEA